MPGLIETEGPKKILFVCARNKIRSLTAEKMFAGAQPYQVRSRGVANDARVRLTGGDLGWADVIFVMEKRHKERITEKFREKVTGKKIVCLFIEDMYKPMEVALIAELRRTLAPYRLLPPESGCDVR
ncbi:MAG: protein tyrosine phosphatase [Verrucomicrobiota bacterium]